MTYELPDEVREAAARALNPEPWEQENQFGNPFVDEPVLQAKYEGFYRDGIQERKNVELARVDALTPILAAHFERIGAEKMREAAAQAIEPMDGYTDWNKQFHPGVFGPKFAAAIRTLPLPAQHDSQTTNDTEEASVPSFGPSPADSLTIRKAEEATDVPL